MFMLSYNSLQVWAILCQSILLVGCGCADGEIVEEESEEQLMAQLGLKLEEQLAQLDADKALDSRLARRWGAQESARDRDQWQPLRSMPEADPDGADAGGGRVLEFEDIDDFLFTLGD
jgi:hypothetical protein